MKAFTLTAKERNPASHNPTSSPQNTPCRAHAIDPWKNIHTSITHTPFTPRVSASRAVYNTLPACPIGHQAFRTHTGEHHAPFTRC